MRVGPFREKPFVLRRFIVPILLFALSSPTAVVGAAASGCMTEKSNAPDRTQAESAHACCAKTEAPETSSQTCRMWTLAMSCCGLEPAPYRETGAGALPAYAHFQPDQPDANASLPGARIVEPAVHGKALSSGPDFARPPSPLRKLFCTYLI